MADVILSDAIVLADATVDIGTRSFADYDAYLGEQGLLFFTGQEAVKVTETKALEPTRQDVGNRPFEIRPESGHFFGQGEFQGGQGQRWAHRQGADDTAYLYSEGFDITDPGKLKHLKQVTTHAVSLTGSRRLAVIGGALFIANGNNLSRLSSLTAAATTEDPHAGEAATAVEDVAGTGTIGYIALGTNGIHQRDAAGTYTHYSDVQATRLMYYRETRLIATDGRNLYEITAGGAAPAAIITLPTGWEFTDLTDEGRFIYASAVSTGKNQSRIYIFGLKSDASGIENKGWSIVPDGELVYSVKGHLGNVYLGYGKVNNDGGKDPGLYRGVIDDKGFIGLDKIAEGKGAGTRDLAVRAMASDGRFLLLGWTLGTGSAFGSREGMAQFDPARGSFSHHHFSALEPATPDPPLGMTVFEGKHVWTSVDGLFYDAATYADAYLISSMANWNNAGLKSWDLFEIAHKALPTGSSVEVQYTNEEAEENIFVSVGTSQIPFGKGETFRVTEELAARQLAIKLVSTPTDDNTEAPEIESFSVRAFPTVQTPEYRLQRTVQIFSRDRKEPNGRQVLQNPRSVRDFIRGQYQKFFTWWEADARYTVRLTGWREIVPASPDYETTTGESAEEAYFVILELEGVEL